MIRKVSSFFCNFANVMNNVTICQRFAISTESSSQCICLTIIRHISMYVTTSIVLLSDIQTGKVTGQMPRRALHLVFEWLDLHKDELMENWERMENGETLVKINPLD